MIELTAQEWVKVAVKRFVAALFYCTFAWRLFLRYGRKAVFIVVYHRVLPDDGRSVLPYISVGEKQFEKHLRFFKRNFDVIPLDAAVDLLSGSEELKKNCLVVTFDDGYRDNYDYAFPVLVQCRTPGVFYVATGLLGTTDLLWPDAVRQLLYSRKGAGARKTIRKVKRTISKLKTLNGDEKSKWLRETAESSGMDIDGTMMFEMMSWENAREMVAKGMTIGSHTHSHPILRHLSPADIDAEIKLAKTSIEERIGVQASHFAYPNGTRQDLTNDVVEAVKRSGYRSAVTTIRGANYLGADLFTLRRTGVYRTDTVLEIVSKICLEKALCG